MTSTPTPNREANTQMDLPRGISYDPKVADKPYKVSVGRGSERRQYRVVTIAEATVLAEAARHGVR